MTLGAVHLTVADLDRSLAFYTSALGLTASREAGRAVLTAGGPELLVLHEEPGARPSHGYSGLFHFALLLPERRDLARWLAHAIGTHVPLTGMSDHFVSEAIYLDDPDGHGIEIYWDRPRSVWEGQVAQRMTTLPLDRAGLLAEAGPEPFTVLAPGTVMGHVHLRVADVPAAIAFYRAELGLELMASFGKQAAFLAADGYHHHIGANIWESAGAGQPPPGYAGLRHFTMHVPGGEARDLQDPSGNKLQLR